MAQKTDEDTKSSLEKIKKRLANASSSCLMEGALLKRSETLRKWNQRWFTLDPSTGKMEYRAQHGDSSPRGLIWFEPDSTITLSPINFHGAKKYDGCCFYVGTPQKKEYYLCGETPTIAGVWVSTLRAAALVLKAHKEAVDSLSGNGHAKLGTVAAVVAAANATAREGMMEIQQSMKAPVKPIQLSPSKGSEISGDDMSTVLKETLRVKDEELNQVARDLRSRDYMIKEMADRLSSTAEAAEAAAEAACSMEKERKLIQAELDDFKKVFNDRLYHAASEVKAGDERLAAAVKVKELALHEAKRWQLELGKGREQIVMMEAAVIRAEDSARRAVAEVEGRLKAAVIAKEAAINQGKQWQEQADYYQGQAARYLGLLQQKEALMESRRENPEEGHQLHRRDESSIEIPVIQELRCTVPLENTPSDAGAHLDEHGHDTSQGLAPTAEENFENEPSRSEGPGLTCTTEGLDLDSDKDLTVITAVDCEQFQVDTFHSRRPEGVPEQQPELSASLTLTAPAAVESARSSNLTELPAVESGTGSDSNPSMTLSSSATAVDGSSNFPRNGD